MKRRDEDGDLIFIILGVFLAMMLLATLDAEGQDLDSGLSAGYMAWWDSPERALWHASRGLAVVGVPKVPRLANAPQAPPQAAPGPSMVAGSYEGVLGIMHTLRTGTCLYVGWNGWVVLVKGDRTPPENTAHWPDSMRRAKEARHCRGGVG